MTIIIFSCFFFRMVSSKEKGTGESTNFPAEIKSVWCLRVLGPNPMHFSAVNNLSLSRHSSSTADRGREALSRLDKRQQRLRVSWSLDELIRENSRWKAERRTEKKKEGKKRQLGSDVPDRDDSLTDWRHRGGKWKSRDFWQINRQENRDVYSK